MTGRMLRTELRRGPFWVAALAVAWLGVVFTQTLTRVPLNWATSVLAGLETAVALVQGLALAAAVWWGSRERRRGMGELLGSTPRPRLQRALITWLPTAMWPALACAAAALAFGVLSMRATSGPPLFDVLAAVIAAVVAYTALGFVLGWYMPGRFVAPVAGVAAYMATILLGNVGGPVGLLSAVPRLYNGSPEYATWFDIRSWDRPVWWFALAVAVWFLGLTAALLTASMARRRWLAVAPAALAAVATVPLVWAPTWRVDTASPLLACSDGEVRVCVPDATGARLSAVADASRQVRARLEDVPEIPDVYVWPQCRELIDRVSCSASWDSREDSQGLAGWVTLWRCVPDAGIDTSSSPAPRLRAGARAWLLGRTGNEASPAARRIAALPENDRHAWLSRYLHAAQACDASAIGALRSELRSR